MYWMKIDENLDVCLWYIFILFLIDFLIIFKIIVVFFGVLMWEGVLFVLVS